MKHWYINAYDRPLYTEDESAHRMSWRGPYSKRDVSELTGTSYDYMHTDGTACYTPDYPCKHPPARYYTWFAYDDTLCICCCECGEVLAGGA